MEATWSVAVIVVLVVVIVALLIAYLYKRKAISNAEVEVGAAGFTLKLKLQDKERHISESEFGLININDNYADSDIGFVIRKPFSDEWIFKKLSFKELLIERGFVDKAVEYLLDSLGKSITDPNENIHIKSIRRGEAQTFKFTKETLINGILISDKNLKNAQALTSGEEKSHDLINIFAYNKNAFKTKQSLLDIFLSEVPLISKLGPKKLYVNADNSVFLLDNSAIFEKVIYNGQLGTHITNNMSLFQENNQYFFEVILNYIQSDDKPTQVWDELRDYLASFRVLAN